ncbi:MAG: hypothetical protein V3U90_07100 [Dehalococcoidia bacterium]
MPLRNILDRLNAGEVLILDGGTGSELQRRGVNVNKGSTTEVLGAWSACEALGWFDSQMTWAYH